ncbi:hypothetical protein LguiA_025503 [Lonicera macranthoides]
MLQKAVHSQSSTSSSSGSEYFPPPQPKKKQTASVLPLHKQKKMSKEAKREANALSRLSKPNKPDPDEYQWQLLLVDQQKRKEEAANTSVLQERAMQAAPDVSHIKNEVAGFWLHFWFFTEIDPFSSFGAAAVPSSSYFLFSFDSVWLSNVSQPAATAVSSQADYFSADCCFVHASAVAWSSSLLHFQCFLTVQSALSFCRILFLQKHCSQFKKRQFCLDCFCAFFPFVCQPVLACFALFIDHIV